MQHDRIRLGKKGEEIAAKHLICKGYTILERNWRFETKEVDIIAQKDDELIFVEVKTRKQDLFESPKEAVSTSKQQHLFKAAEAYLETSGYEGKVRFDIVSITLYKNKTKTEHIEDAFYPVIH
jgi:putative endonuclease